MTWSLLLPGKAPSEQLSYEPVSRTALVDDQGHVAESRINPLPLILNPAPPPPNIKYSPLWYVMYNIVGVFNIRGGGDFDIRKGISVSDHVLARKRFGV